MEKKGVVNPPQLPFPSPCIAVREEVENFGVKLRLGKKGGVRGKVLLNLVFISHHPPLISLVIIS